MVASSYHGVLADEAARQSCGWVQRETAALCEALAKASAGGRLRASAPAEVSFVRTGTRSAARSDDLNAFRGLERRRTHCYIRIQRRELALKVDSNVFIRVYISTLLGSLKTGAYGSA